jgi:catalase
MNLVAWATALAAVTAATSTSVARAEDAPVVVQVVDALQARYGVHPGYRANHVKVWPDTRNVVDLGTPTLDKLAPDSDAEQRKLLFLPGRLTAGIEPSDDPLIAARDGSYAVSFGRRSSAPP